MEGDKSGQNRMKVNESWWGIMKGNVNEWICMKLDESGCQMDESGPKLIKWMSVDESR